MYKKIKIYIGELEKLNILCVILKCIGFIVKKNK